MLFVHLTDAQRTELADLSRQAVGRVALRAQMVCRSDRGYPVPAIAAIHGCGPEVVRLWRHRYQDHGAPGLADRPRPGRPPRDPLARQIVDVQAGQAPSCSGHVQSGWTVALLTAFLAVRFGLARSAATVRRHRHATGWRWRRPRLAPASTLPATRDPAAPAKWAAITRAARRARRGRCRLLFLDACDRQLLPVGRSCWQQGTRRRVPTPGTNARRAVCGALDAVSGACSTADHARKLAVPFGAFLDRLAAASPSGPLVLVMDTVATHHAKVVRRWLAAHPRVQVRWLPTYAGHEANPIERIWGLLKDAVAANRLRGSLDELTAAAHRFFATLAPHPVPPSFFAKTA